MSKPAILCVDDELVVLNSLKYNLKTSLRMITFMKLLKVLMRQWKSLRNSKRMR
jgi:hypothetical protein